MQSLAPMPVASTSEPAVFKKSRRDKCFDLACTTVSSLFHAHSLGRALVPNRALAPNRALVCIYCDLLSGVPGGERVFGVRSLSAKGAQFLTRMRKLGKTLSDTLSSGQR